MPMNDLNKVSSHDTYKTLPKEAAANNMKRSRGSIHFIGVGGVGMSGLAQLCIDAGYRVSGSDLNESVRTRKLSDAGARVFFGHKAGNIPLDTDRVIVSTAIAHDNPELCEAHARGIAICHRSDLLAEFFLDATCGVAIAGCHGKTTITSMMGTVFKVAGADPTIVVGGYLHAIDGHSCSGHSGLLIAEADESDGTFLKYFPRHAIISNIDNDHLDHYGSLEKICKAFEVFATHVDPEGTLWVCQDDANARNMAFPKGLRVMTYGIDHPADVMATNVNLMPHGSAFNLTVGGIERGSFELAVPGLHNVLNALPVIALALEYGLSVRQVRDGIKAFQGAGRRFETKGEWRGIKIVDDYGHHPSEIKATLAAARQLHAKRLLVVFQPHRYSRTMLLQQEFGRCFDDCDRLFITDIYAASEKPIPGVTSKLILDQLPVPQRRKARLVKDLDDALLRVLQTVREGDVIFTLGAGNITRLGTDILAALQRRDLLAEPAS